MFKRQWLTWEFVRSSVLEPQISWGVYKLTRTYNYWKKIVCSCGVVFTFRIQTFCSRVSLCLTGLSLSSSSPSHCKRSNPLVSTSRRWRALRWLSLNSWRRNTKLSEEEKGIPLRIYNCNICRSCLAVEATTSPGRCLDCGTSSSLLASTFVLPRGRNGLVPCIGPESDNTISLIDGGTVPCGLIGWCHMAKLYVCYAPCRHMLHGRATWWNQFGVHIARVRNRNYKKLSYATCTLITTS